MTFPLASFAQYFRIALELGLCKPEEAREWAISVIDRMDEPPGEIIEVSWRKPLAQVISDLNQIKGEPDMDLVCRWLLERILLTLEATDNSLHSAVQQAMGATRAAGNSDLFDVFNVIDDQLALAITQTYGTVHACREDFEKALREHAITPSFSLQKV
jgi:hypothetical protein